jgi:hypothetical protein
MFLNQLTANEVETSAAGFCAINKGIIVSVSYVPFNLYQFNISLSNSSRVTL